MALGGLPPWLNVQPSDFVHAAASGAALGHAIADSTLRAWEEQARMRMAAQEAAANREQHAQQVAVENAMARLAADRLEQYRQSEIANRQKELGIQQQGLGLRGENIDVQRQRFEDMNKRFAERQDDLEKQRDFRNKQTDLMNEMKQRQFDEGVRRFNEEMDRKEKAMGQKTPHFSTGPDGKLYATDPLTLKSTLVEYPKPQSDEASSGPSLLSRLPGIAESVLTGNAINDYLNRKPTPTTNAAPAVGLSYAPQETQAAPPPVDFPNPRRAKQPTQGAVPASPKKRVRVTGPNGQTGTIEEGDTLPDGWKVAE